MVLGLLRGSSSADTRRIVEESVADPPCEVSTDSANNTNNADVSVRPPSVLPLSMRVLRMAGGGASCCDGCRKKDETEDSFCDYPVLGNFCQLTSSSSGVSPYVWAPLRGPSLEVAHLPVLERILADYRAACHFYQCNMNAGVLTTLRYALPGLKVTPEFCDVDMMALAEILLKYANGPLRYVRRLDLSRRRLRLDQGLGSHGALILAKVLQTTANVTEVVLERNRIGPYGGAALFLAAGQENSSIQRLSLRRCGLGERGALAFAAHAAQTESLVSVDLSANFLGYKGCLAVERALQARHNASLPNLTMDLEGNLVFQEIMNGVTHGLGVLLAFLGAWILSAAVQEKTHRHVLSCSIYSTSLVVLYTSSTLYHSFFSLRGTKYVFEVLDKCAIYILIAGSYTPFLQIVLANEPIWSFYLLVFLWVLCALGIGVEFTMPAWQYRSKFSLAMYLGMGWSALICLPEVARRLPQDAIHLMVLGGVAYTAGVPFFVRDNNLDHAIWHLFVLAGSIFHWCGIYFYVSPIDPHSIDYS